MAPLDDVQVGDLVSVPGGMHGTVKYLGGVAGKPGKFAGIELAAEHARRGKNSGDVDGRKYFSTGTPGSGIFVPMNNSKYVTKRFAASTTASSVPPTPSRPAVNFSKSVGPSPSLARPRVRQPSLPRPESPQKSPQKATPSKLSQSGLRTPSGATRTGLSPNGFPRSPIKTPSRMSDRPPSRFSTTEDDLPSARTSDFPPSRLSDFPQRSSMSAEIQDLKDNVKSLERQLLERDNQLEEQSSMLGDFQKVLEEMEGSDALSIRNQLREKNEKIAQLTAEFDLHRADFRSTLDTLEIAASETERVYEQRLDELMQQNKELQDRGEDVEAVARQLKQLEELVSELEEGLEDARRGEAESRAEVEFLRGEVERTKLELAKERGSSPGGLSDPHAISDGPWPSKGLDQKDDEIRGLKAIIHSLSRGEPNLSALQQLNGLSPNGSQQDDPEHLTALEQHIQEIEDTADKKTSRIEELEREMQQLQLNGSSRTRRSTVTDSSRQHKPSSSAGNIAGVNTANYAHRLSDRTVVPNDWSDQPYNDGQHQPFYSHHRGVSESSRRRLETMHESDGHSDDGNALWCEICESNGHDILSCTSMFGAGAAAENKKNVIPKEQHSDNEGSAYNNKPTPETSGAEESGQSSLSNSMGSHGDASGSQRTGRDVVLEGLKGISGSSSSMAPTAGKASGVIDGSKWCALCERDGHESIDCPFDE